MRWPSLLLIVLASSAFAADVSGTWKGTAESPNGPLERTFIFKVSGDKLTGETESQMLGKSTITEGKVAGDDISFTITANMQGNEMKLTYKGKVAGDQIKLAVDFPGGDQKIEYTLKKQP